MGSDARAVASRGRSAAGERHRVRNGAGEPPFVLALRRGEPLGSGLLERGLTLARVLHVHGIPAEVYEAEASPEARAQGGMLDIHDYNRQRVIEAAGLMDEFRAIVLEGRQAMRALGQDGTVLFEKADDGTGGGPEAQRADLRQMLLDALPQGTVHWGRHVAGALSLGDGRHEVTFADGSTLTTRLLIGADGAWSRIRLLLSKATPKYAGTSFAETYLFDADTRHPAAAKAVGGGSMYAPTPDKAITAHRERGDTLHAYISLTRPSEWSGRIGVQPNLPRWTAPIKVAKGAKGEQWTGRALGVPNTSKVKP